jgi:hypothetical protein
VAAARCGKSCAFVFAVVVGATAVGSDVAIGDGSARFGGAADSVDGVGFGEGEALALVGLRAAGSEKFVRTMATTAMNAITPAAPTIARPVRRRERRTSEGMVSPRYTMSVLGVSVLNATCPAVAWAA